MIRALCAAAVLLSTSACGGAAPLGDPPAATTRAELVGALCSGDKCACRERDPVDAPPQGKKRFHIKLGPAAQPLWLSVGDSVLYKDQQRGESCFVIDLAPGAHAVRLRGRGATGVAAAVIIEERGNDPESGQEWWYDSFHFRCGAPDLCERAALEREGERIRKLGDRHDPCGSTKVKEISWRTGVSPDGVHPDDLELALKLEVYEFVPTKPPCPGPPQA